MQTVEIDYLDGNITVNEEEPSTIAECVEISGELGVVSEHNSNLRYRNKYPRVYKKSSKELEPTLTREVKGTKTQKDGTIKEIKESEMDHLRKCYKQDAKLTSETIAKYAQSEPLYVKGERAGGGGRISQAALDAANNFFAQGEDVAETKADFIESMVPGYKVARDGDGNVTPESLARGIQALQKHLTQQATKNALEALGKAA
jgi:DNA-directed RNA polymerase subunit F